CLLVDHNHRPKLPPLLLFWVALLISVTNDPVQRKHSPHDQLEKYEALPRFARNIQTGRSSNM
ncbi:MAG: hypothetical protein ABIZ95_11470, partial [Pyrinomonadaceae bacterium]